MNFPRLAARLSCPWRRVIAGFALGCAINEAPAIAAESANGDAATKMEALFSPWSDRGAPGVACVVVQNGKVVYAQGHGLADVARGQPITVDSLFNVGSVAKQFTAACVALLILDGKVTTDTDIRTFFPELRDYGATITVEHLIHHTSGIRDYTELIGFSGWSENEPLDNTVVMDFLARQHSLEFTPGRRFGYSNSNYVLLAEIVRRVSGRTLSQFAEERLFRPLGMKATRFASGVADTEARLARSYRSDGHSAYSDRGQTIGDCNLWTSAADLARWDNNLRTGKVGSQKLLELMRQRAVLPEDKTGDYGFGLFFRNYRGHAIIEHSGLITGYRADLLRFAEQPLSIVILGNVATIDAEQLARSVADVYLAGDAPPAPEPLKEVPLDRAAAAAYSGRYALDAAPDVIVSISMNNDGMFARWSGQQRVPIFPHSEREFFYKVIDARIEFRRETDGTVNRLTLHQNGNHDATRIKGNAVPPSQFGDYTGQYYSEELNSTYTITCENEHLVAETTPLRHTAPLNAISRDTFALPSGDNPGNFIFVSHGAITFRRNAAGRIVGFSLFGDRVSNLIFERRD